MGTKGRTKQARAGEAIKASPERNIQAKVKARQKQASAIEEFLRSHPEKRAKPFMAKPYPEETSRPDREKAKVADVPNQPQPSSPANAKEAATGAPGSSKVIHVSSMAAFYTAPEPFVEQWEKDSAAGEPQPVTAAQTVARVKKTMAEVGYSGLPGKWLSPPEAWTSSRKKHRALIEKARKTIDRLISVLLDLEQIAAPKEILVVRYSEEEWKTWAIFLRGIDRRLAWRDRIIKGTPGAPATPFADEWTVALRGLGLGKGLVSAALRALLLERCDDPEVGKTVVRRRLHRLERGGTKTAQK